MPAAAQRLKQGNRRLQAVELVLRQDILGGKQRLLGLQQGNQIDGALLQPLLGQVERSF